MIEIRVPLEKGDVQVIISWIGESEAELKEAINETIHILDDILDGAEFLAHWTKKRHRNDP